MIKFFFRPLQFKHFFAFSEIQQTQRLTAEEMKKLVQILNIKDNPINHDIHYSGPVRLITEQGKLIGIYEFKEALKKSQGMGQDIIMMNQNVTPAICKTLDYSQVLQQKFINEIVLKERENEEIKKEKQCKQLKFSHKITMTDLKLKVRFTKEMSNKFRKISVQIQCLESQSEQAKNVLLTYRDLTKDFLFTEDEIQIDDVEINQDETKEEKEKRITKNMNEKEIRVSWEFKVINFKEPQKKSQIQSQDIKQLIKDYFNKQKTQQEQETKYFKNKTQKLLEVEVDEHQVYLDSMKNTEVYLNDNSNIIEDSLFDSVAQRRVIMGDRPGRPLTFREKFIKHYNLKNEEDEEIEQFDKDMKLLGDTYQLAPERVLERHIIDDFQAFQFDYAYKFQTLVDGKIKNKEQIK